MKLVTRQSARRMLIFLIAAVVLWALFVWFAQRAVLFPTRLIPAPVAAEPDEGVEVVWLDTPAGKVEGWFIPGEGRAAGDAGHVAQHPAARERVLVRHRNLPARRGHRRRAAGGMKRDCPGATPACGCATARGSHKSRPHTRTLAWHPGNDE